MSGNIYEGLSLNKLFGIFFISCIAGVVIETVWFFITKGVLESRKGLIYGPFNLVYGLGAVCITLALYHFRDGSVPLLFLIGALVGSLIEYICSYVQQSLFGTVSWQYDSFKFNINGRVDPVHTFYWGVLAVVWIKLLFPVVSNWLDKIPGNAVAPLTCLLALFMLWDSCVSGTAVYRMAERHADIPAENKIAEIIDEKYPDERMEKIYTNMEFVDTPFVKKELSFSHLALK